MTRWRIAKVAIFFLCLWPAASLAWRGWQLTQGVEGSLGANPVEFITHSTGDWTLRFLLLTLAVTPLRNLLGWPELIKLRRMLGLFAFFYGTLHLMTWLGLDKFFDPRDMLADVVKRRFITVGMLGVALMIPLAVTSTTGWIRRMGGKNWQRLHKLVYISAVCGVVHYYWLVKSDIRLPALYGALLALELGYRGWKAAAKKRALTSPQPAVAVRQG